MRLLKSFVLSLMVQSPVLAFAPIPTRRRYTDVHWRRQGNLLLEFRTSESPTRRHMTSTVDLIKRPHRLSDREKEIERAQQAHGMPWRTSLSQKGDQNLYYMPFWEWQLDFMKKNLKNLRVLPCTSRGSTQYPDADNIFDYKESEDGKSRIVSLCFASDEFQKIRMTYYENGQVGQSFNTVWYPRASYNLPILGVNLLSKSALNKHLAIIDFQPLHKEQENHALPFSHLQGDILAKYPKLDADENDRIWNLQVFSKQMLCKRFQDEAMVTDQIFPAFCDFVESHVEHLVKRTTPDPSPTAQQAVMDRHVAYDTYSSVRDPCTPLLGSLFGKEWAEEFVYGFLYSLSERKEEDYWTAAQEEKSN